MSEEGSEQVGREIGEEQWKVEQSTTVPSTEDAYLVQYLTEAETARWPPLLPDKLY